MIAAGSEIIRRLQVVSQMRDFLLEMRRNNSAAYDRGEFPYKPPYDIRSDADYWLRLKAERDAALKRD